MRRSRRRTAAGVVRIRTLTGALSVMLGACLVWSVTPAVSAPSGSLLWTRRYGGTFFDLAHAVATGPDGSTVFVAGTGYLRGSDYDIVTVAYDARSGARRWIDRYDGPAGAEDYLDSLVVSPDGSRVFVSGTSWGSGSDDVVTIAYRASTGGRIWVSRRGPLRMQDYARGLAVSPDGSRVFVTATTERIATGTDAVTLAYRAATGRVLWSDRYRSPGDASDQAQSLTVSPDGGEVFVSVLRSRGGEPTHVVLAEDAATGARRWASHDTGPISFTDETPITVAAAPDGSAIFVAGTAEGRDRATRFGTLAYDPATGALLWARRSAGAPGAHAVANAFAVSPDGSKVFVSGQTSSGRPTVYATVAYRAATGATVWTRTYAGPAGGYNAANAIAVTSDGGRVYVTGESAGQGGDVDVATLAYRAVDGTKVWGSRFGGPSSGDGRALAVAVGPNGRRVFVAGVSDQGGAQYFLTIAYRG